MTLGESTLEFAWRAKVGRSTYSDKVYANIQDAHAVALEMLRLSPSQFSATTVKVSRTVRMLDGTLGLCGLELVE